MKPTEEYQQAVSEARTLVKRSEEDQWRLAELTYQSYQTGVSMGVWATDVGVSASYAHRLRRMWENLDVNQVHNRNFPPFTEAYHEVSPASRYQPRQSEVTYSPEYDGAGSVEEQAAFIKQAISNPEVAEAVFDNLDSKIHAMGAMRRNDQRAGVSPPAPQPVVTILDVLNLIADAKGDIRRAFRLTITGDFNDGAKLHILSDLTDVDSESEKFRAYLTGMNVDDAIEKIMQEGV